MTHVICVVTYLCHCALIVSDINPQLQKVGFMMSVSLHILHDDVTFFVKMADFRGAAMCVESTSGALYP